VKTSWISLKTLLPPALLLYSVLLQAPVNRSKDQHPSSADARVSVRSVTPSEIGLFFAVPNGFAWKDVGAYVGNPDSEYFAQMSLGALRIQHGRFQFFSPADDTQFSLFPYSRLKQYDARESAAGPSLFVTATYKGKRRPVYFAWSLGLRDDIPSAPRTNWMQAVDVSSNRFIDFWVHRYVQAILWRGRVPRPTQWVGIDNCAFMWELYGVIDDDGRFVAGVPWDPPYPQNSDQYLASIEQFFHKLMQVAPDIQLMCNVGSLKDPSQFQRVYVDVPGIMAEDILEADPREFARAGKYDLLNSFSWFGSLGRVAVLRANVRRDSAQDLRTAYMIYLLVKGPNFFFAPEFNDSVSAVPPSQYARMRSDLGEPTAAMRIERETGKGPPFNLYSRTYERGIIYVNWTGAPQDISLPHDRYFDFSGRPLTAVTVPDLTGTYVTTNVPTPRN
jgi:hypothetical protein